MTQAVRKERRGAASFITIERPEVKNALNLEAIQEITAALREAETDDARVVVLQGAGGDFSAGGDINDMVARRGKAVATYDRLRTGLGAIVNAVLQHPKPVLARVDGVCMGAGAGIALACDALLASERSVFGFPFVKVGLVPDTATSWLVPHIAGLQTARRLLLTGESVRAPEAQALGLVTSLVPDAAALDREVAAWIERFAALPATAVRDAKRLVNRNKLLPVEVAVLQESMMQGIRFTTDEHARAVDAFLSQRKGGTR